MTNKTEDKTVVSTEKAVLSPYGAARIVNVILEAEGLKAIPPQMMYNYTTARLRAGKKPAIAYTPETGVDAADLQRWTTEYVAKKHAKATVVAETVAAELTSTEA